MNETEMNETEMNDIKAEKEKIKKNKLYQCIGYVIKVDIDAESPNYYSLDKASGGYPYWSSSITSAQIFNSKEEALKIVIEDPSFNRGSKMANGTIYPPSMVQSGANVNSDKLESKCTIFINPLIIGPFDFSRTFDVKIKRPTGFKYI